MGKESVYYFSAIDYEFLTQRPQQLFKEWICRFIDEKSFYYVEPFRSEINLSPKVVPSILRLPFYFHFTKYGLPQLEFINNWSLNFMVKRRRSSKRVAITCNNIWEPYINKTSFDVICYDYLDALEVHAASKDFPLIKSRHVRLLEKSDIIFVTAEKLRNEVCQTHPNKHVVLVSNGVDFDFFANNCKSTQLTDYIKSDRKVVGYVGAIYDWINLELVHASARLTPDYDYVMIGPLSASNRIVAESKPGNVIYLGSKPYEQVPSYINIFDVALIPFVKSNISESTDPIKLYEYFALGKPTVATPMKQLDKFDDGVKLTIADGAVDFAEAIRNHCIMDNIERQIMRKEIACQNSWASKAELITESLDKFFVGMV